METLNEDNTIFVPMIENSVFDAYLDDWITRDQLLEILLREPERLNEKDRKSLMENHSALEHIIRQHDIARSLRTAQ